MYDGLDFFAGPLDAGMCTYRELKDGTLTLADVAIMNDMLMCRRENTARADAAAEASKS